MKKATLVVVLALVLTFVFAASAFATTGKFYKGGVDYYTWSNPTGSASPGTGWVASGLSGIGVNGANPGVHANYLANTAKCGICHSVHRAKAGGTKLLPTYDATCSGCHTQGTTVTTKIITVATLNPNFTLDGLNGPAGGLGGPHNDDAVTLYDDGYWDGVGVAPAPSYDLGRRYGCFTRRCHATNPHGANASKYKIFAAKLLFNDTPAQDDARYPELVALNGPGTYGGLDAVYNNLGATDAAVARYDAANADITASAVTGLIRIQGVLPNDAQTHALVAGLTCGRPSNPKTGEDECHAEAAYAIVTTNIKENRNHGTKILGAGYVTDNTGAEALGFGGNDHRDSKTGHVAGSFGADASLTAYSPIAGCTSCHDQTDSANTVAGNFTFPHGQTPTGNTNLVLEDGVTSATGVRSRIWAGWAGQVGDPLIYTAGTDQKAYDGQCLKCHRTFDGEGTVGIGITQ
jgi:hypothetical protein